jgi:hypothetical protein
MSKVIVRYFSASKSLPGASETRALHWLNIHHKTVQAPSSCRHFVFEHMDNVVYIFRRLNPLDNGLFDASERGVGAGTSFYLQQLSAS